VPATGSCRADAKPLAEQGWFGYAGEQRGEPARHMTPLKSFVGNSCSSAMNAFGEQHPRSATASTIAIKPGGE
jgi:hypothetical protein